MTHEELVEEQRFLLRSIADLDAERAAGDIGEDDYRALRDDYVARAAACAHALAGDVVDDAAIVPEAPQARRRTPLVIAGSLVFAAVAGLAVAAGAGSRTAGAPVTGSLPQSTSARLALAARLAGQGEAVEAVKIYDRVLEEEPNQPVALAYRGWLVRLAGLETEGLEYVERAIAADSTYPDAHFFRGMMLWKDRGDPGAAVEEFRLVLASRPTKEMVPLVERALREASAEAASPAP